ncbi:phosphatase PAP2 family protein [Mesorhizobium sp. SP-1A]|uniref:phosphatase PAP2 family protein n=1 Tax=Mesorhizobium sp. SP-1A TaxID=3077840 RepID=UPI0028F6EBB7|nr:phosphatase PAP2 family protein [Mesorhizobium sp. SP-1A]
MKRDGSRLIGRVEFPLLLGGLIIVGCLWGFVEMMEAARSAAPHSFDTDILLALRQPGHTDVPIGPRWLQETMRDVTSLGSISILAPVTAATVGYFLVTRRPRTALFMFLAVAGGQLIGTLTKLGVERPRPELVSHLMDVSTYSFPSGHALMSAVTYLTLGSLAARSLDGRAARAYVLLLAVAVTLLVGFSRIYLGVHWPSDVLGGWFAGFAWALLCWLAARLLQRRRDQASPPSSTDSEAGSLPAR